MRFVTVPPGDFTMGATASEELSDYEERPARRVYPDQFDIAESVVSVGEWKEFIAATGYSWGSASPASPSEAERWEAFLLESGCGKAPLASADSEMLFKNLSQVSPTDNHPISYVSWFDCLAYCEWRSSLTGTAVTLPTEAQWERACRGTNGYDVPWGTIPAELCAEREQALSCSTPGGGSLIHPSVDSPSLKRSAGGCLGMWQVVSEWCRDHYDPELYRRSESATDSAHGVGGVYRSIRGGSYWTKGWPRCTLRKYNFPQFRHWNLGFRMVASRGK